MKKAAVPQTTSEDKPTQQKDHFILRIPRLKFKEGSLNVYLVFVLIIFAFLLGMLTNKVISLEKELKGTDTSASATADVQGAEPTIPPPPQFVDVENGHLPLLGDNNAQVTIVEFSDFQCPFCKQYFDATHGQIDEKYVKTGKVKFAYRHLPLTSIHPNAQRAGEAAECANEQDKFWEYHDLLFKNQDTWSPQASDEVTSSFVAYAGELSLNTDQFRSCIESEKYKQKVNDDLAAGDAAQVDGTPAFFINGQRLTGAQPFSEFERVIEEALKK